MGVCRWRPVRFDDEITHAEYKGTVWAHERRPVEIGGHLPGTITLFYLDNPIRHTHTQSTRLTFGFP